MQSLSKLPGDVRTRMAVRLGLFELRKSHDEHATPTNLLNEEIDFLTRMIKQHRAEAERLQAMILAAKPKDAEQAKRLLAFVSRLVASGQDFKRQSLAEALDNCATALAAPANRNAPAYKRSS